LTIHNNLGYTAYDVEMKTTGKVVTQARYRVIPRHSDAHNPKIVVPSVNN